ncbi:MAG: Rrf2 family transcriptional regulator [Gammaproteobacteria bacterium]
MAHLTASVEYGMHCLLWLAATEDTALSSRDLAALQGVSPAFVAKIFPKLEKAGIVSASNGLRGGYRLARPASRISVLDVVDAIEGRKPLFDCQEIRGRCALFEDRPPKWATNGVCAIHAVMLQAERAMREALAAQTLDDLAQAVDRKAPASFGGEVQAWLGARTSARGAKRGPRKREAPS